MVHPDLGRHEGPDSRSIEGRVNEAVGLAEAIGLDVQRAEAVRLKIMRPATLFGTGVLERLKQGIEEVQATVVIVDGHLSPVQQRNLEREWQVKVIDRTGLILEIFGARARTHEGRLQVELAALTYQRSRLVRSWTHLERQRGG
ncbi:MAG: GTPase HflX, partial [Elstera sp.]